MKNIRKKSQVATNILTSRSKSAIQDSFILKHLKIVMLLFIIIFGSTLILNAQQECTDGVHDYKVIDSYMSVTTAISQGLLLPANQAKTTAQYVVLTSELAIDIDYDFASHSDIIGDQNGKIFISGNRHLTIDGAQLHGCNKLMRGIYMEGGGVVTIKNSNIYNFYRVFYMTGGSGQTVTLENNIFENNKYVVVTDGITDVTTDIFGNTFIGGTIGPPYAYNDDIGIAFKLKNVDNFTIGNPAKAQNHFENYNGKENKACIQIDFNDFSGTNQTNIEIVNSDFILLVDSEININSDLSREDEVYITNCEFSHASIKADGLNHLTITDCDFSHPTVDLPYIFTNGNEVYVSYNKFYWSDEDNNASSFYVANSNIVEITDNETFNTKGFEIKDCIGLEGRVSDNIFNNTDLGLCFTNNICNGFLFSENNIETYGDGFRISLSENYTIENNYIEHYLTNPPIWQWSISQIDCEGYRVAHNNIFGAGLASGNIDFGIFCNNSPFGVLKCNVLKDIPNSFLIINDNDPLDLVANSMKNIIHAGVKIGDFGLPGIIGDQYKNGNRWKDDIPTALELDAPNGPVFTITNTGTMNQGIDLIPNPYEGNIQIVNGQISDKEDFTYCLLCEYEPPREVSGNDFNDYWRGAMTDLYLGRDCSEESENCAGSLFDVQFNILTALYHNPELLNEVENASQFWNDKINTPLGELFSIDKTLERISSISQLDSLQNVLSNINTSKIYETNFKEVLNLRIRAFKSGSDWSTEEIAMLESIAGQCPSSGGKGVGIARSLLGKDFREYNDTELCDTIEERSTINYNHDIAVLFPNPAKEYFDINLNQEFETGTVEIFNSIGQKILVLELNKNEVQRRVEFKLKNGIYSVQIVLDKMIVFTGKLEILK